MAFKDFAKKTGHGVAMATALLGAVALTAAPGAAYARDHGGWHGGGGWHHHHGGISTGAAVGIGLGSFALGAALGSASAYPYYGYSYPYYGYSYPSYGYAYPYYGGGYAYPYYSYGYGY